MLKTLTTSLQRWLSQQRFLPGFLYNRLQSALRKRHAQRYPKGIVARTYVTAVIDDLPLQPNDVLYESFHGKSFNCSPAAICLALLDDPAYAHLTHIWAVNEPNVLPSVILAHPNVRWVHRKEPDYGRALATAGTVITNTTLGAYFTRRDGQVYANTWHGVPLKRMFRFEGGALTRHANSQRNFLQASHLLMPNRYTADALMVSADVAGLVAPQVTCLGAPRIDLTLTAGRDALRRKLGIAPDCQVIMVAPTWRGTISDRDDDMPQIDALLDQLNTLDARKYQVFVQMHDFVVTPNMRARALPADLTTNQFLAAVDVLITDYSSIMFDMFATGRQVVLFAYDLDDYTAARGLLADLTTLPTPVCADVGAVMAAVKTGQRSDVDSRYDAARALYFPDDDGQAAARAVTQIFNLPATPNPTSLAKRTRILIFGGAWKNNGITSSVINLLGALGGYDVDVYVVTNGAIIDRTPEYIANIKQVHPAIHMIHRTGTMKSTPAEQDALDAFYDTQVFRDTAEARMVHQMFQRETRRMFGDVTFDVAIDFGGYSRFWSMLIAAAPADRHAIYLHNDMLSEAQIRFKSLFGVFTIYQYYDMLVSVSPTTSALNIQNLAQYFPKPDMPTSVRNMIDPAQIIARSKAALPDDLTLPKGPTRFVSVGRLSGEKAQDRIIIALAELRAAGHNAELVLIGDGPLYDDLVAAAHTHGVADHVIFTGQRPNPFAIMAHCDCFVLSSDYEGQPMVLLEALCLGLPIVATDIVGVRSVMDTKDTPLVGTSVAGVLAGMAAYMTGNYPVQPFDSAAYCDTVMQEFITRVVKQPMTLRAPAKD